MRITDKATVANLRTVGVTIAAGLALTVMLALTAGASAPCQQSDGQWGQYNGTTEDDEGCITEAEYAEKFSVANLLDKGAIIEAIPNGDGTMTVTYANGALGVLVGDPLERTTEATSDLDPIGPTVREVLYTFRPLAWR